VAGGLQLDQQLGNERGRIATALQRGRDRLGAEVGAAAAGLELEEGGDSAELVGRMPTGRSRGVVHSLNLLVERALVCGLKIDLDLVIIGREVGFPLCVQLVLLGLLARDLAVMGGKHARPQPAETLSAALGHGPHTTAPAGLVQALARTAGELRGLSDSREPTEAARPLCCDALVPSVLGFGRQFLSPTFNQKALRSSSGSLAKFAVMRRASSRVSRFGRRAVRRSDTSGIGGDLN
jgi:hypothetical protein